MKQKTKRMEKKNNENRIEYIDIARGIAIILMVLGHVIDVSLSRNFIFSFHMPLFIIISGFFYKDDSWKNAIVKGIKKLIIPYIICIIITDILLAIFNRNIEYINVIDFLKQIFFSYAFSGIFTFFNAKPLSHLWFFPLLLLTKLIFKYDKTVCKNEFQMLALITFEVYIGYIFGVFRIFLPWSFDVALYSLIFYYFGYLLKKYNILEKIFSNKSVLALLTTIWLLGMCLNSIELATRRYPGGIWCAIVAICGSVVVIYISKLIDNRLKNISKILKWYGKNSCWIILLHFMEKELINYDFLNVFSNKGYVCFIEFICKIIIITFFMVMIVKIKKNINGRIGVKQNV